MARRRRAGAVTRVLLMLVVACAVSGAFAQSEDAASAGAKVLSAVVHCAVLCKAEIKVDVRKCFQGNSGAGLYDGCTLAARMFDFDHTVTGKRVGRALA